MAQKKPTTPLPFEQHSSSSDDEEEEVSSGEEEATPFEQADSSSDDEKISSHEEGEDEEDETDDEEQVTPLDPVKPAVPKVRATQKQQQTRADSSSDDEVEEEVSSEPEEEEEEPNVTPVAPVKPVVPKVRATQKQQQPDLAPATAPASAVTVGKKRPGDSKAAAGIVSKKLKKVEDKRPGDKRVAEDVVKKVGDYPEKKRFQRVFSEKDEIMLLNSLLDYSANKCIDPMEDITEFHEFVKNSIHADVTSAQLSSKIKKMKSKYKKNVSNSKETFGKGHDQSCYDLSKLIWGKSSSASGGSELKTDRKEKRIPKTKKMTPGLQIPQVVEEPVPENISWCELAKTRDVVGMMCLSDDTFKKNLELLSNDEARAALEDKLKNIVTAEVELIYKRLELSRELMKSSLDGHRG